MSSSDSLNVQHVSNSTKASIDREFLGKAFQIVNIWEEDPQYLLEVVSACAQGLICHHLEEVREVIASMETDPM